MPNYGKCSKCGTPQIAVSCSDPGCCTMHLACPKCRAVPCDVCGEPRQPEAEFGLCDQCHRDAIIWAAKMAHAEKRVKDLVRKPGEGDEHGG